MKRRRFSTALLGGLAGLALPGRARADNVSSATVEAAKREGSFSYWDTVIQPETNDELAAAFKKTYGLPDSFQVNFTATLSSNLVTQLEQQLSAGRVVVDVAAIASPTWVFEKIAQGHIMEYDSPEYQHYDKIFAAGMGQRGFFAFNGAYTFIPMWNADTSTFNGTSWRDVIGAVPPHRLSVGDATLSATYLLTFLGVHRALGDDFFLDVAKMQPQFVVASQQVASRLVTGQDMMALFGLPTRAMQNNQNGANLKFIIPTEGAVLLPQATFILKKAPNPNAAKLWIDFILSEPAQIILARREALISGRANFQTPSPDYAPNLGTIKVIDMNWKDLKTSDVQQAQADWRRLFKL
jgi:iron(III) transport system substrate-binding protein